MKSLVGTRSRNIDNVKWCPLGDQNYPIPVEYRRTHKPSELDKNVRRTLVEDELLFWTAMISDARKVSFPLIIYWVAKRESAQYTQSKNVNIIVWRLLKFKHACYELIIGRKQKLSGYCDP